MNKIMKPIKIDVVRVHWDCGDGCCSESGFEVDCFCGDRCLYDSGTWSDNHSYNHLVEYAIEAIREFIGKKPIKGKDFIICKYECDEKDGGNRWDGSF